MPKSRNQRSYQSYKGPQSSPMWRDPGHTAKHVGCLVVLIAPLMPVVLAGLWVVVR